MTKKKQHPSRASDSLAPSYRRQRLHERLKRGEIVTLFSMSEEFGVDERTIERDIEHMRDRLDAPIVPVPGTKGGYRYNRTFDKLPFTKINVGEAIAFALASRLLAAWRGTPLGHALRSVMDKLAPLVAGAVTFPFDLINGAIFLPDEAEIAEYRHMGVLMETCQLSHELHLVYQKPGGTPEPRIVQPLNVACPGKHWILVSWDPKAGDYRHFRLSRIHEATNTGKAFTRPAHYNAQAHLAGNLGAYTGDEQHTVVVVLSGLPAHEARDIRWHTSQTNVELPDGRLQITLQLNNLVDIRTEILRHGPDAEALAPAELRATLAADAARMHAMYSRPAQPVASSPSADASARVES